MLATAKVFNSGNSQAIRLPKAFRVDAREMWISKSAVTGEITLKPMPVHDEMQAFITELKAMPKTDEFLIPRTNIPRADPFEGWVE